MLEYFNYRVIWKYMDQYMIGLWATVWISMIALFFALILGICACLLRLSTSRFGSGPAAAYIETFRSSPLLAQLYFFYFGLPGLGIYLSEIQVGILVLALNNGAYIAEIIRGGILSVSPGQVEAGTASGLNFYQRMRYIVLPQAIGVVVPPLLGQAIIMVKETALLSLISVLELTRAGQNLLSERLMPAEAFFTTAAFYLFIYFIMKLFSVWAGNKLIHKEAS